jgi:hypothetical protein
VRGVDSRNKTEIGTYDHIITLAALSNYSISRDQVMDNTMDAVIFRGPFDVAVERRPKPEIREPTDAIVRVRVSGICGR